DPGIVDQDFDRSERCLDRVYPFGAGVEVGDVEFEDRDPGFSVEQLCRLVIAAVIRRDPIADIIQGHRDRAADTPRSAGDDRHPGHEFPPILISASANHAPSTWQFPCRRRCTMSPDPFSRCAAASTAAGW